MFIRTKSYPDISKKYNIPSLILLAKRMLPDYVFNMSSLENNPYTFPEVQTLMDGITVGGHKLSDQQQILDIKDSWSFLFDTIRKGKFSIDKKMFNKLHSIVARNEALIVGDFRTGSVGIAGTNYVPPAPKELNNIFDTELALIKERCKTATELALEIFLFGALNQFYYDGNKRTSRLMSNGILISSCQGVLNIKAKDKLEFNSLMVEFYTDPNHNADNICDFLYNNCISHF